MFKPTLGNLWDYIVDESCLRTDCGTEEYLIKWNGQHRVPVNIDEVSSGATKYGITIPEERKDKEVTLVEDLPFDEKSIFMYDEYINGPYIERATDFNDPILCFTIQVGDSGAVDYAFPILGHKTITKTFYSSLDLPEGAYISDYEYGDTKIIIDFFGKPVLLTYQKRYWNEETQQEDGDTFLDSEGNKLKANFSSFSFDDTTELGYQSLHFDIDGIRFNMNPHYPEFPDGFKFDNENMVQNPGIDYDEVLKRAQKLVKDILEDNMNYYSTIRSWYKTGPNLDNTLRWLQGADIYGGKITDVYDKALNKKLLITDVQEDPTPIIDSMFGLMYGNKETIDGHTYCTAAFGVGDKSLLPEEPVKTIAITINDESNYQSVPMIEGDPELTLIDNVLSSLTNEQKYSLFTLFERMENKQSLVLPRETLESEETFRSFILSLVSSEWTQLFER